MKKKPIKKLFLTVSILILAALTLQVIPYIPEIPEGVFSEKATTSANSVFTIWGFMLAALPGVLVLAWVSRFFDR